MAPSRGSAVAGASDATTALLSSSSSTRQYQAAAGSSPPHEFQGNEQDETRGFTLRAVLVGALVGTVICFSNMYFGLQTGWVSPMTMPASLLGFGIFRLFERYKLLDLPRFGPVENVLVQTVAGSMAVMPLGCGFVGVIPALSYLLKPSESGPIVFTFPQSVIWSIGLCYFGVLFAVPLRKQVLIREKLRFPSGFSTAVLIGVLHGRAPHAHHRAHQDDDDAHRFGALAGPGALPRPVGDEEEGRADPKASSDINNNPANDDAEAEAEAEADSTDTPSDVVSTASASSASILSQAVSIAYSRECNPPPPAAPSLTLLLTTFAVSGLFNLAAYFFPVLRAVPVFGANTAQTWLWDLNPSPAYVGQGVIMGPETTLHMLLGAVVGWGILSPLAKWKGWAPGDVADWETGSKGWIVWVSLAIMLADSVVSLGFIILEPLNGTVQRLGNRAWWWVRRLARGNTDPKRPRGWRQRGGSEYLPVATSDEAAEGAISLPTDMATTLRRRRRHSSAVTVPNSSPEESEDAPPSDLIPSPVVWIGLILSVALCASASSYVLWPLFPPILSLLAVLAAILLSIMGIRALGQTDLNPVSGISKLSQLLFAVVSPLFPSYSSVLINLVAGAIAEAGALQSGELMQDLKTGHLLAAKPSAQFWGQVIGATLGALVSAGAYHVYVAAYDIPGDLFPVPTAYVWVFTARLVSGRGLPPMAAVWALGAGLLFAVLTAIRAAAAARHAKSKMRSRRRRGSCASAGGHDDLEQVALTSPSSWTKFVPGGIAVAVGMYNVPSFTLARTAGGLLNWWWMRREGAQMTPLIILASGFILGEGFLSIVNLLMQSLGVPHY